MAQANKNPVSEIHSGGNGAAEDVELVFNKFDTNGDGKISLSELGAILRALGGVAPPPEELQRVMNDIDADGDGFINLKEFCAFYNGGCNGSTVDANKELRDAFDLYDQDRNGVISAEELLSVLTKLGEKSSLKQCRKMIESVDIDGDGSVNFEEFKRMMTRS